ncbi:MAG: MFS transporter, partial [Rhodoglobus sp.]
MNSVPANQRGAASGMTGTFQNAGNSLSIGIFFSLMIAGLASTLPNALRSGLTTHGVSSAVANQVAATPPVGSLFAAFLGYNPIASILGPTGALDSLSAANSAALTGKSFFPQLISEPFHAGLVIVFIAAAIMSVIGAVASLAMGGKYVHVDEPALDTAGALSDV